MAFEYLWTIPGPQCPSSWATKSSETPAALRRLACVCRRLYSQKYSMPASFSAFAQVFRTSFAGCPGVRKLGKTKGDSVPFSSRQLNSSALHLAESGILRMPARVFDWKHVYGVPCQDCAVRSKYCGLFHWNTPIQVGTSSPDSALSEGK
jgi:hypothetical protein